MNHVLFKCSMARQVCVGSVSSALAKERLCCMVGLLKFLLHYLCEKEKLCVLGDKKKHPLNYVDFVEK